MSANRSRTFLIALTCVGFAAAYAATTRPDVGAQTPRPGSANSITERSLRAHLEFLASDAMNGRASNSRDEWIAATYIASQFQMWNLEPMGDNGGYVQAAEILREQMSAPAVLSAGTGQFTHGKEMLVTALTGAKVSGPLVKLAPGVTSVPAGSVVLMPEAPAGPPAAAGRGRGGAPQPTVGAALVISLATQTPEQWTTAAAKPVSAGSRFAKVTPPAGGLVRTARVALNRDAYNAVAALAEGTAVSLQAELSATKAFTWNAVGRLTGSDPTAREQFVVLGAHLDHIGMRENAPGPDKIFNGADDDASGTVAVMALAQALAAGPRPKRTLVFALFGSEEGGGTVSGSSYFVELPVVAIEKMVAQLQFEMLARPDPMVPARSLWLTGYERSNLGSQLAKQGARLVQDPRPDQSFFTRSDNIKFARKGVISHTVSSFNLHTDYHQAGDEVSKVDFAHMLDAVRSMLEPVRWLANSTFTPVWAPEGRPR
ncbi:MAG: M20/M25/M40 family metallo-hydrolase [Acidobacteria bacterium]|nr:M20/M25/M40 family metallo-hydrolase [Acidobacteriota bacterium]